MAGQIGIPQDQSQDIERGALLHDIGKIGISDNILLKPAKLTENEWVEIRNHPDIGYRILAKIDFLKGAAELVLQHHERFDGTGYPRGPLRAKGFYWAQESSLWLTRSMR